MTDLPGPVLPPCMQNGHETINPSSSRYISAPVVFIRRTKLDKVQNPGLFAAPDFTLDIVEFPSLSEHSSGGGRPSAVRQEPWATTSQLSLRWFVGAAAEMYDCVLSPSCGTRPGQIIAALTGGLSNMFICFECVRSVIIRLLHPL